MPDDVELELLLEELLLEELLLVLSEPPALVPPEPVSSSSSPHADATTLVAASAIEPFKKFLRESFISRPSHLPLVRPNWSPHANQ